MNIQILRFLAIFGFGLIAGAGFEVGRFLVRVAINP